MKNTTFFIKLTYFLFILFTTIYGNSSQKKAFIITGPESSGSVFITRTIATVLGKDFKKNDPWAGYGLIGTMGDDLIVFHYSQPSYNAYTYCDLSEFHQKFEDYDLYFIITTRDVNIVKKSKTTRFGRSEIETKENEEISKEILSEIIQKEKFFIWNYETQIYLKEAYFQLLYKFLDIESDFFPQNLKDENKKHLIW